MAGESDSAVSPRWLDEDEMAAWLPFIRVVALLPQALDKQLREQAGVNHTYYMILALLSALPDRKLSMTELARQASTSQPRLSQAVQSLEKQGWVAREPCPTDRRVQYARLTDRGLALLERVAPAHVAEVRRLVCDRLDREELAQLRHLMEKLVAPLEQ
jgi:DNA-binding MarR family transcriptional regulator